MDWQLNHKMEQATREDKGEVRKGSVNLKINKIVKEMEKMEEVMTRTREEEKARMTSNHLKDHRRPPR